MRQMSILQDSSFHDGASNMAIDSAIAEAVAEGNQLPTLRLYGWQPFCLSLGYGQRTRDVDLPALKARAWDLVRRPTGGKAILHGDELTYSLSLPLDHPLARGDVIESYRRISIALLRALERLGVAARAEHQGADFRSADAGPVCFEIPSHYEIKVGPRKLIGSAQLRRKGGMLQHGSIPLFGDLARICQVLAFDSDEARGQQECSVRARALSLSQVTKQTPTWSQVAAAIEWGFASAFDLDLLPRALSDSETSRASELKAERFGNPAWTMKR